MMQKKLVVLQNAYARTLPAASRMRDSQALWLRALNRSRSGVRLKHLLGEDYLRRTDIRFANTTPEVAVGNRKLPVNYRHMQELLAVQPDETLVIACGEQARRICCQLWEGRLLAIPHPACRVLSNCLLTRAAELLAEADWPSPQLHLIQQRDGAYREACLERPRRKRKLP